MRPLLGFAQFILGTSLNDLVAMLHVVVDHLLEIEGLRTTMNQRHYVHPEGLLELRVFEQLILNHHRYRIALELDDDAHAVAVRFVPEVGNAFDLFVAGQQGNFLQEGALIDLVGDFGGDQRIPTRSDFFFVDPGTHDYPAATGMVGLAHLRVAINDASRREVRSRHELDQLINLDRGIVDVGHRSIDDLGQIVRRNLGGHPDGDTIGAVDQQVGNGSGQDFRLLKRAVEVVLEIDRFFAEILEHLLGQARHPRLGVSHGSSAITVDGPEVALSVHQQVAQGEILRHADHGIIDGRIPVGVVLTEYLTDYTCALFIGRARAHSLLVHPEEDAPVDRLQPIPNVGEGSTHDDRHRVVDVGGFHFLLDVDRNDAWEVGSAGFVHPLKRSRGCARYAVKG